MAFSLVGWSESQDSATLIIHAALDDQHITIDGDDILVPNFASNLMGYYAIGADLTQAQLSSPSLRAKNLIDIAPFDATAEPEEPSAVHIFPDRAVALVSGEGLRFLAAEDGAGAARQTGFAWLMDQIDAAPGGEVRTVRAQATQTLVANVWTLGTITFDQQLEAGRYAIIGFRAEAAGLVAARLVIPGSAFRPGVVGYDAVNDTENQMFRRGMLGNWGEFEHTFPPQVEFLSVSADTTEVLYLDLVKVT